MYVWGGSEKEFARKRYTFRRWEFKVLVYVEFKVLVYVEFKVLVYVIYSLAGAVPFALWLKVITQVSEIAARFGVKLSKVLVSIGYLS